MTGRHDYPARVVLGALSLVLFLAGCGGSAPEEPGLEPPEVRAENILPGPVWNWQSGDLAGWSLSGVNALVSFPQAGGLSLEAPSAPDFPDLFMRSPALALSGRDHPIVLVDLEAIVPAAQTDLALYYTTDTHGEEFGFRGAPREGGPLAAGERRVLVYDMRALAAGGDDWTDSIIRKIRFDLPQGASSHHVVHSIRICHASEADCT